MFSILLYLNFVHVWLYSVYFGVLCSKLMQYKETVNFSTFCYFFACHMLCVGSVLPAVHQPFVEHLWIMWLQFRFSPLYDPVIITTQNFDFCHKYIVLAQT